MVNKIFLKIPVIVTNYYSVVVPRVFKYSTHARVCSYDFLSSFVYFQVNHVLAVCIVGYTAAIVSAVAGTILAQECSHQINAAIQHLTSLSTSASLPNSTLAPCLDEPLHQIPPEALHDIITDSLHSMTG